MTEPKRRGRPRVERPRLETAPKPLKEMTPAELRQYRADMRARSRQRQAEGVPTPTKGRIYLSAGEAQNLLDAQASGELLWAQEGIEGVPHKRLTAWLPVELIGRIHAAVENSGGALDLTDFMTEAVRAHLERLEQN